MKEIKNAGYLVLLLTVFTVSLYFSVIKSAATAQQMDAWQLWDSLHLVSAQHINNSRWVWLDPKHTPVLHPQLNTVILHKKMPCVKRQWGWLVSWTISLLESWQDFLKSVPNTEMLIFLKGALKAVVRYKISENSRTVILLLPVIDFF